MQAAPLYAGTHGYPSLLSSIRGYLRSYLTSCAARCATLRYVSPSISPARELLPGGDASKRITSTSGPAYPCAKQEKEVDPQAMAFDREEKFNLPLFRKLGELGLLGVTVPEEYGGAAFDATAACIVHEELAAAGM